MQPYCKKCSNIKRMERDKKNLKNAKIRHKRWRDNNKEKISMKNNEWNTKNREYYTNWFIQNKEYRTIYFKSWYDENKSICKEYMYNWRKQNPDLVNNLRSKHRGYGFKPINRYFKCSRCHHLHLENNTSFSIFLPEWLHTLYWHNSDTWQNMDTVNAIALDFWINEKFYYNFFELINSKLISLT